jgi:hypothetical protein
MIAIYFTRGGGVGAADLGRHIEGLPKSRDFTNLSLRFRSSTASVSPCLLLGFALLAATAYKQPPFLYFPRLKVCPVIDTMLLLSFLTAAAATYSNPFCGFTTSRDTVSVSLECAPGAGAMTAVSFAAYGTPDLSQGCGSYHHNSSCDLAGFLATAQSACVGKTSCVLEADSSTPDPCPEVIKTIAIQALCASAPGGQQVPNTPVYPVVPSCATQNGVPPCPLPVSPWTPTWALNRSTICQPGNTADFLNATQAARFGLISLDWSVANTVWRPAGTPCNATTGAAVLVEQCRQIQAVDPTTKCFVCESPL